LKGLENGKIGFKPPFKKPPNKIFNLKIGTKGCYKDEEPCITLILIK
jgi:hypothetical protein